MATTMGEQSRLREDFSPLRRKGSIRKVLPSIPGGVETRINMSAKMIDPRGNGNTSENPAYAPYFLEYALLAEYSMVQRQKLTGIYVIPAACTPLQWYGVLFVREGFYEGGIFRFTLYIPDEYPDGGCPRVIFETPVFHPLVDIESGELDLSKGFQSWRRNVNHLWQVLIYTKRVFYKIETTSPSNPEAAVLYDKDIDVFKQKVGESIQKCGSSILEPPSTDDPHAIRFSPWDPSVHEHVRNKILTPKVEDEERRTPSGGLSWVEPGSLRTFSKNLTS